MPRSPLPEPAAKGLVEGGKRHESGGESVRAQPERTQPAERRRQPGGPAGAAHRPCRARPGEVPHQYVLRGAVVGLSDPGGDYLQRVSRLAEVGVIGAVLTALGFGIGGQAWGFVVIAAFVVTLLGGLAATFGLHRLVVAMLLN